MNVFLEAGQFKKVLASTGMVICGQTDNIVPADKKLYALRDATATVSCIPLIASSIMSKKLALGSDGIVLASRPAAAPSCASRGLHPPLPHHGGHRRKDGPPHPGHHLQYGPTARPRRGQRPGDHRVHRGPERQRPRRRHGGHLRARYCMLRAGGNGDELRAGQGEIRRGCRFRQALPFSGASSPPRGGSRRVRRLFPAAGKPGPGGIHRPGLGNHRAHRLVRDRHGRHRHRRRPPQEGGCRRPWRRLRLPRNVGDKVAKDRSW